MRLVVASSVSRVATHKRSIELTEGSTPAPIKAASEVGKGQPGSQARRFLGPIALLCLVLFLGDAWVIETQGFNAFDRGVELFVQSLPWGPVVYLFAAINWLAGYYQIAFGLLVAAVFFIWDRRAGWLIFIGSGASLIDNLIKLSFQRQRPSADLVHVFVPASAYSFPSGHAVFFTWLSVMLAAALAPRLRPRYRPLLWLAALLLIFVTCLERVHDGVHWPTDVLGGLLLGLGWSAFVLWLPERWLPTPSRTWWRFPKRRDSPPN
jgi:membrane-associated phospholipid phosphatase